ncbi:Casparian strip membrane protein domain, partial [Dillenia turbinata]
RFHEKLGKNVVGVRRRFEMRKGEGNEFWVCDELIWLLRMDEVPGSVGTTAGFSLRLGQTFFSSASLLFMSLGVEFYSYTAFCFLVTIMGLVIPWSFTLGLVDGYSVLVKCPLRQPGVLLLIVIGDWVLSILTLAAACSTASVVDLLLQSDGYCPQKICSRYQLSAAMAFLSWFLSVASALFNLWLLPSLL